MKQLPTAAKVEAMRAIKNQKLWPTSWHSLQNFTKSCKRRLFRFAGDTFHLVMLFSFAFFFNIAGEKKQKSNYTHFG